MRCPGSILVAVRNVLVLEGACIVVVVATDVIVTSSAAGYGSSGMPTLVAIHWALNRLVIIHCSG
jgi:hypothetical protein